jgi:hypothetical protein
LARGTGPGRKERAEPPYDVPLSPSKNVLAFEERASAFVVVLQGTKL